jgi:hypothetical protein
VGERLDVGWAMDVLHPLARREAGRQPPPEERPSSPHPSAIALADVPPGHFE